MAHDAAGAERRNSAVGHALPAHERKITRMVAVSLASLGFFLISVCAFSWSGLSRFQSSLSLITDNDLPRVMTAVRTTSRLSTLLVGMERLFRAETGQGQSLAREEIQRRMNEFTESLSARDELAVLPQLESVGKYLDRLIVMAEERLLVRERLFRLLNDMDDLALRMESDAFDFSPRPGDINAGVLRGARGDLLRLLSRIRWSIVTGEELPQGLLEHAVARDLEAIRVRLPEAAHKTRRATDEAEALLLGENGLIAAHIRIMALREAMVRLHDNSRNLVLDLIDAQSSFFNKLAEASASTAEQTGRELRVFTQFFLFISGIGLLASAGIYLHFRKVFIIRLEKLNASLLQGVHGELPPIDTSGSDEIAGIALAVEHFARELKISSELAQASSKAKSAFIANMSHEIRTPMNAVIGFTRMTLETELTQVQRGHLEKIENSARLLLGIIDNILDFSKIEAGKLDVEPVAFTLRAVIDNVADACGGKASAKGLRFTATVSPDVPDSLTGDPVRLFQVLSSLCDNAVKFTAAGEIGLDVTVSEALGEKVALLFSVSDQGIGMTEEQVETLFQPFTQADVSATRRFGGTGLGLTISKALCELMGGSLAVSSAYGKGSVFSLTLPFDRVEEAAEDAGREDAGPPDLSGLRLLIVEDNLINQEIMLALLEKTQARIDVADNGRQALSMVEEGVYDVVLMDIQMPEMDGISATTAIRALSDAARSGLPVIAMTAHALESDRQMCLDAGMNDHIAKPIAPEELYAALRKWAPRRGSAAGVV